MIGHQHDKRWIGEKVERLPYRFSKPLERKYQSTYDAKGRQAANLLLLEIEEATAGASWRLAASDDDLVQWAKKRAENARGIKAGARDMDNAYLYLLEFCERSEIEPEKVSKQRTVSGAVLRMCCELWWRRRVRTCIGRRVEGAAVALGLVNNRAGLYASDETVHRRHEQRSRSRAMLEACQAVNELGQSYTLAELAALSVSNPTIKRGELMVRMSGFEQYANSQEHVGDFYTWTCPSRMHYSSEKYDGTTPRAAQQYLCKQWAKARAAMRRAELTIYGFRVAEPHHDGCPHWHMLFFMPAGDRDQVRAILSKYALQVDGNEPGAAKHRFTVVAIDKRKGTAAGYLAKYVSKNIDAYGVGSVDEDLTGKRDPRECAARVDAWAGAWGIRQFQQVGGQGVTKWRELRRLGDQVQECEPIEYARQAANVADWAKYCTAGRGVALAKRTTGELNRYDELKGPEIVGIRAGAVVVTTRVHTWRIERAKSVEMFEGRGVGGCDVLGVGVFRGDTGAKREGNRGAGEGGDLSVLGFDLQGAAATPWSPVNNCTGEDEKNGRDGKTGGGVGGRGRPGAASAASDAGAGRVGVGAWSAGAVAGHG